MSLKPIILSICAEAILAFIASQHALAAKFRWEQTVYVISSVATVRTGPRDDAPAAAKLPIGTKAIFKGSPSELASSPDNECKGANAQTGNKWSCVCFDDLLDEEGASWCGWVVTDLLAKWQPTLTEILVQYDKTPPDELPERRKGLNAPQH